LSQTVRRRLGALRTVIVYQSGAVLDTQGAHLERLNTMAGLRAWRDFLVDHQRRVPHEDKPGRRQEVRTVATTTRALLELRDWLVCQGARAPSVPGGGGQAPDALLRRRVGSGRAGVGGRGGRPAVLGEPLDGVAERIGRLRALSRSLGREHAPACECLTAP
jgi:hypothetical protein